MNWRPAPPADARAAFAAHWMGTRGGVALGTVVLRPHQRAAAERLRALLDEARGALLADQAGLGKTYTALAVARDATRLLIVAPAALRAMWHEALAAAGVHARFVSYQALSRGAAPAAPDFVILDEAHHARNPATIRYRALAALCARAPVLLLSATPVHNRVEDLRAELALFLGERAWTAREDELARFVVKRDLADLDAGRESPDLPRVGGVRWVDVGDDAALLDALVRLPAPLPPREAGDGGALLTIALVRQWASSRAALQAALRRRLAQAQALDQALRAGRHPSRRELPRLELRRRRPRNSPSPSWRPTPCSPAPARCSPPAAATPTPWPACSGSFRLARIPTTSVPSACAASAWRIRRRGSWCSPSSPPPWPRCTRVCDRMAAWPCSPTAAAWWPAVPCRGATCWPSSRPAATATARAERVSMLIATDLLSEGVNLQEASVVVHADLPWSPARFEQRVGRVRRLASPHAEVHVYALRPPAPADRMLRLERRLRDKLAAAAHTVGVHGTIMPSLFSAVSFGTPSPACALEQSRRLLAGWRPRHRRPRADRRCAAAMRPAAGGWHSSTARGGASWWPTWAAARRTRPTSCSAPRGLARGARAPVDPAAVGAALQRVAAWAQERETL